MSHHLFCLLLFAAAAPAAATVEPRGAPLLEQPSGPGLWIGGAPFGPADIEDVERVEDKNSALPAILLTFTEDGRHRFAALQQGRVGEILEIAVDGELLSAPVLREPIAGGELLILGAFSEAEAAALVGRIENAVHRRKRR